MAIARIPTQDASGTGTTSASATYAATPTQNDLLIAVVKDDNGSQAISGWTQAVIVGTQNICAIFYKIAGASEPTTVTANDAGASNMNIFIYEYSGLVKTSVLDKTASNSAGGTTTTSSGTTATTTVIYELCIAFIVLRGTNTVTAVSNSFNIRNSVTGSLVIADNIVADFGAYTTNFTTSVVTNGTLDGAGIATFKGTVSTITGIQTITF